MTLFEKLVLAAANRESLVLRELALEFLAQNPTFEHIPQPDFSDPIQLAIAAGLLELFATRRGHAAPNWVKNFSSPIPFSWWQPPNECHIFDNYAKRMHRLSFVNEACLRLQTFSSLLES
jgi:hypothetical protein